jgi:hypothetical protein
LRFPLPTPERTLLLEALLLAGDPARAAWDEWNRLVGDPLARLRGGASDRYRALLPLLATALDERRLVDVDGPLATLARSALLREERRHERSLEICRKALGALEGAGLSILTCGGAPMAERLWRVPGARHSGGPRFVVEGGRLGEALAALRAAGFEYPGHGAGGDPTEPGVVRLLDPSGLSFLVGSRLVDLPLRSPLGSRLAAQAVEWKVAGTSWRGPGAAHTVFELCVDACLVGGESSLLWVPDLLAAIGPSVDWDELLRTVDATMLELPFARILGYAAERFGAPVPDEALLRPARRRSPTRRQDVEEALVRARAAGRSGAEPLIRSAPGRAEALRRAWWIAVPSRRFLRQAYGAASPWAILTAYGLRPLRWMRSQLASSRRASI